MNLSLAPLHGFTDSTFRNVFFRYFGGFDDAVAPFVSLTHCDYISRRKVRELLPENNSGIPLIPQILGNEAPEFIRMCNFLYNELGYQEVNWNMGCPIKGIVSKKRGSGILPYPVFIDELLSQIMPGINVGLSVKLRLGYRSANEFEKVIEILNKYPLNSVIIHPRTGLQQYEGPLQLDELERYLPMIRAKVCFSGDIHSYEAYHKISHRFTSIQSFMLGRGVLMNPSLGEMIRSNSSEKTIDAQHRFCKFYHDLEQSKQLTSYYWMSKMKEYWKYFYFFTGTDQSELWELMKCNEVNTWNSLTGKILDRMMR